MNPNRPQMSFSEQKEMEKKQKAVKQLALQKAAEKKQAHQEYLNSKKKFEDFSD